MDRENQIQRLLQHAFFRELEPMEAKALFSAGSVRAVRPGQILFEEGKPEDGLYFVLDGVFEVRVNALDKSLPVLAHVQAGEVIGEIGLLNRQPRTASVLASTEAFVWHLSRDIFEGLLDRGDSLAGGLLKGMSEDLCRRFRAVVYEGAALMGELAPSTETLIRQDSPEWKSS